MTACVLFFVQYPEPGRVQTRLAAETSPEAAAALQRAMTEDLLSMLRWAGAETIVCYAPEVPEERYRDWLGPERTYWPQKGRDLGARMANAFRKALVVQGRDKAVLLGADIPELTDEAVRQALESLAWNTVCLGPSRDRGWYLVGFEREAYLPDLLSHVDGDRSDALSKALNLLDIYRRRVTLLDELGGLGSLEDVRRLAADPPPHLARSRTLAQARRMLASSPGV